MTLKGLPIWRPLWVFKIDHAPILKDTHPFPPGFNWILAGLARFIFIFIFMVNKTSIAFDPSQSYSYVPFHPHQIPFYNP